MKLLNVFSASFLPSLFAAALVLGSVDQALAQQDYKLTVVTDQSKALYEVNATAKFLVTVTKGKERVTDGSVSFVVDDFITEFPSANSDFPKGDLKLSDKGEIAVTSTKPGFLRCRVSFMTPEKRLQAIAAAGFSPRKIEPSLPVPDDFDEFWAKQKAELAKVKLEPKLTEVKHSDATLECFDLQVKCAGGAPVSGYFVKPKSAKPKSLPIVLWVHGAGVRSSSLSTAIGGAKAGMLSLDINAHGIANGKPGDYYRDQTNGPLRNYRFAGRESRDTIYFRGMYLRLVRAIDFLTAQPEWDGKVVAVIGHSQGGGQALVAGGIDERVTFIATGVPAICDHSGRSAGRINGWPKLVPTESNGKPNSKILEAARYVDAVNFASRCKADAIMSVGFIDGVCPPSSCYAAFNVIKGKKQVLNRPLMGHAAPGDIRIAFFEQIKLHVKSSGR
jgi:cephalosporin-C deacetylase